jgi:hypothetical protein
MKPLVRSLVLGAKVVPGMRAVFVFLGRVSAGISATLPLQHDVHLPPRTPSSTPRESADTGASATIEMLRVEKPNQRERRGAVRAFMEGFNAPRDPKDLSDSGAELLAEILVYLVAVLTMSYEYGKIHWHMNQRELLLTRRIDRLEERLAALVEERSADSALWQKCVEDANQRGKCASGRTWLMPWLTPLQCECCALRSARAGPGSVLGRRPDDEHTKVN